jgi:cbb3-type cytochrome oxidase subunit 3
MDWSLLAFILMVILLILIVYFIFEKRIEAISDNIK